MNRSGISLHLHHNRPSIAPKAPRGASADRRPLGLTEDPDIVIPLLHRLSFYSGHSSFSMYCMLFLAVSSITRCIFTISG